MIRKEDLELVKELIRDGYSNLDAVSFELDIPMADLIMLKKQVMHEREIAKQIEKNAREREHSVSMMR